MRWVEASILGMLGYLLAMADEPELARDYHDRSRAIYEELGMSFSLAARTVNSARIEVMAGDLDSAERSSAGGTSSSSGSARPRSAPRSRPCSHRSCTTRGATTRPRAFALTSDELAAADDVYSQLLWRSALAKVRARRDGTEERARSPRRR